MKGISGCPVNPPIRMFTAVASASSCVDRRVVMWPAFSMERSNIVIADSSNWSRTGVVKARLLFSFDLHHFGVVNDDLDGPKPNPFQGQQDCLLDSSG